MTPPRAAEMPLTRSADVAFVDSGDRVALLDLGHPESIPLVLEDPGAEIWRLLDEPRTAEELVAVLSGSYAAEPTTIRRDTLAFVEQLRDRGLVVRGTPAPPQVP